MLVTLKAWKTDVWHNLFSHKIKLSGLSLGEKMCFPINLRLSTPASSRHSRLSCITTQLAAALRPPMAEPPLHPPSTQQAPPPPSGAIWRLDCPYDILESPVYWLSEHKSWNLSNAFESRTKFISDTIFLKDNHWQNWAIFAGDNVLIAADIYINRHSSSLSSLRGVVTDSRFLLRSPKSHKATKQKNIIALNT